MQEAAHQLQPGLALPGPEDLIIEDSGTLSFGFGSESSESPVAALAGLLDSLLSNVEAPQSLKDLASQNIGPEPAHATVDSFSQALAFFERPNRANDIRAVAIRLGAPRQKSTADQEFERLREKVAHASEPEKTEKPEEKKKKRRKQPRLSKAQQMAVVAGVCMVVFGTLGYRSGLHQNVGSVTTGIESVVQRVVGAGLEFFSISKSASAASAEVPPGTASEPIEKEREPKRLSHPDRVVKAATRAGGPSASGRSAGSSQLAPRSDRLVATPESQLANPPTAQRAAPPEPIARSATPAPVPVTPVVTITPATRAIFSGNDPEVQPPVLVRPQLPSEPKPGDDTGILTMLIDENGDVEQVKLTSPRRRYHDRMLVAAAKAWKFRPAMLDGYPVKYRIQIPIILKGMP